MNKKNLAIMISCLIVSLQLAGCFSVTEGMHGTPPDYASQEQLISAADAIVEGEVVKEYDAKKLWLTSNKTGIAEVDESNQVLFTVFDVRVNDVIKGDLEVGDVIQIKQLGDKKKSPVSEIVSSGGYYEKGGQYIFFLASFENVLPGISFEPLHPSLGQLEIVEGKIKTNADNLFFENGNVREDVIEDLKKKVG